MADQSNEMVSRVARAIDAVQCFFRFNNWTSDRVEGFPVEICRHGGDGEDEIVVIRRFPTAASGTDALFSVVSEMRARAAIEALRTPTTVVIVAVEQKAEERYRAAPEMLRWYGDDVWNAGIDAALSHDEVKA